MGIHNINKKISSKLGLLGLPLGPIYWFGIGNLQMASGEQLTIHSGIMSLLPYLCVLIPILALVYAMLIDTENKELQRIFLISFAVAVLIQPFLFASVYVLHGGYLFVKWLH
jgi:hypothetical protein